MPEIVLHKNARTTPAIRAEIAKSELTYREIAKKYNISIDTVAKWKKRGDVYDRSHRRKNINSSLSAIEEEIVIKIGNCSELREKVRLVVT